MARAKKMSRRRAAPRGPRKDWVYRPTYQGSDVEGMSATDLLGSYDQQVFGSTSGLTGSSSRILYDSHNRIINVMRGALTGGLTIGMPNAARAAGRGPTCHLVQGVIYVEPTTWAIGNLISWGWRLGVFEQDPLSGAIELDPGYSMWVTTEAINPATWANMGRQNLWEKRLFYGFSDNSRFTTVRMNVPIKVRLQDHECLALYYEGEGTSVDVRTQYWLRTLVTAGST